MKNIKHIALMLLVATAAVGCYKDKGDYFTGSWTGIVSIKGMELSNLNSSTHEIMEYEMISINPKITYKPGVDESRITYHWVMGGDTIASTKNLNWQAQRTSKMVDANYMNFWLTINNTATGETWQQGVLHKSEAITIAIIPARQPNIGIFVYKKSDDTIDWGSIKGIKKTPVESLTEIYVDIFKYYNPTKSITGEFIAATLSGSLMIYTDNPDNYGAIISTTNNNTYPLGALTGSIKDEVFPETELKIEINSANRYLEDMQDLLLGTSLHMGPSTSVQHLSILPGSVPTQNNVAQVMPVATETGIHSFGIQRTTTDEVYYYYLRNGNSYFRVPLTYAAATVTADQIVGVFRQPKTASTVVTKIFIVLRKGTTYTLYSYNLTRKTTGNDLLTFASKTDITSWAGGLDGTERWFTNATAVALNPIFIAKGDQLWRTSSESLEDPVSIKKFNDPICEVGVTSVFEYKLVKSDYFTALFTYNQAAGTSNIYILNLTGSSVIEYSPITTTIPGKVMKYLPTNL